MYQIKKKGPSSMHTGPRARQEVQTIHLIAFPETVGGLGWADVIDGGGGSPRASATDGTSISLFCRADSWAVRYAWAAQSVCRLGEAGERGGGILETESV